MKTKFVVRTIEDHYGSIKLTMVKWTPPVPEPEPEEIVYPLDPLDTIKPTTDEERVAVKLLKAFRKYGQFPAPQPRGRVSRPIMASPSVGGNVIFLTKEEYTDMGSPGLGAIIEADFNMPLTVIEHEADQ